MIREILCQILEEVLDALAAEDSIEAYGYIERIRDIIDREGYGAEQIPDDVRTLN